MHFTHDMNDCVEYVPLDDQFTISTANGVTAVEGYGTVILNCPDNVGRTTVRIMPVFYIPDLTSRLLSMGEFLRGGLTVRGDSRHIALHQKSGKIFLVFYPRHADDTIYCVKSLPSLEVMFISPTVYKVDYGIMHRRFAHPSRDVLRHARDHTLRFPTIEFPSEDPVCRGCAEGKMPQRPFPSSSKRASKPFERIH